MDCEDRIIDSGDGSRKSVDGSADSECRNELETTEGE